MASSVEAGLREPPEDPHPFSVISRKDTSMNEQVRVIRMLVYEGDRDRVEKTLSLSLKGTLECGNGRISSGTIGDFPDILTDKNPPVIASEYQQEPRGSGDAARKNFNGDVGISQSDFPE